MTSDPTPVPMQAGAHDPDAKARASRPSVQHDAMTPEHDAVTPERDAVHDDVQRIVDALDDKRATDIVVLDLHDVSDTLDWFVVASGESSLQLKALEDAVRERMKGSGRLPRGVEGPSLRWVLLDYGSVVVHIMSPEARTFYDLEGLWADAERVDVVPSR